MTRSWRWRVIPFAWQDGHEGAWPGASAVGVVLDLCRRQRFGREPVPTAQVWPGMSAWGIDGRVSLPTAEVWPGTCAHGRGLAWDVCLGHRWARKGVRSRAQRRHGDRSPFSNTPLRLGSNLPILARIGYSHRIKRSLAGPGASAATPEALVRGPGLRPGGRS
jgi:hypothetical protein